MEMENRLKLPVAAVACTGYDDASLEAKLSELISLVNGLEALKPGARVGIKANLVSAMGPDKAATTHPALLAALVRILLKAGASEVVVGDSPGGLFNAAFVSRVYRASGMDAVVAAGGRLNDDFGQSEGHFENARVAHSFTYTSWIDKIDLLINFSKLKSHGMMGMSNATKNLFGIVPGTMKPEYHFRFPDHDAFADMLIDLAEFAAPVLSITDAIVGMEGNGPTQGSPREIGVLLASKSPYNLDLVAAEIIGLKASDVPTLTAAARRGLSPQTANEVELLSDTPLPKLTDFEHVAVRRSLSFSGNQGVLGRAFSFVARKALSSRPVVRRGCIGCKRCAEICPAKAIVMKKGKPEIDRSSCIRCFCCQEFCPVGAMQVHRTAIARLLTKSK